MADPSSGTQGPAGIRVAPRHRPPPTRAPCLERGARNPPRRVRDKSPSRRMQARNPFHRMQAGESPAPKAGKQDAPSNAPPAAGQ